MKNKKIMHDYSRVPSYIPDGRWYNTLKKLPRFFPDRDSWLKYVYSLKGNTLKDRRSMADEIWAEYEIKLAIDNNK